MIDLKPFCAEEDGTRYGIAKPFSQGDFTFATNGHIAIRVPRIAEVAEEPVAPDMQTRLFGLYKWDEDCAWLKPPEPIFEISDCTFCGGKGRVRTERSRNSSPCEMCDGTGKDRTGSVLVAGPKGWTRIASRYIELILTLPTPLIAVVGNESDLNMKPVRLNFTGGDGLIMPMRR